MDAKVPNKVGEKSSDNIWGKSLGKKSVKKVTKKVGGKSVRKSWGEKFRRKYWGKIRKQS